MSRSVQYDLKLSQAYQNYVSGHVPDLTLRAAQLELTKLGFNPGAIDGFGGARTTAALVAYQRQHGLPTDGIIGSATKALLLGRYLK